MPWTVEIGNQGAALDEYPALDFDFIKRLNAVGWGHANLAGLDGNPEPAEDDVIRFIYDKGGTEYVHFEGLLLHNERIGTDPMRKVTFLDVAGAQLWRARTGAERHYEDKTPHQIIQGAITPSNLLTNAQGSSVLTYGTSASVPNKVDATNPGVTLDDFVADSTRLLINVQRLCLQSRYGTAGVPDGSYGLEFFGQLEGANNSNPRFYLVKRQERAASYTPETFAVGDEFFKARRGEKGLTASEALRVIGGGHGQTRIQSGVIGSGGLEGIVQDKSIIATTNATNMATRLQGLLDPTNEAITAYSYKHDYDTRLGDDITTTQTGFSNKTLRAFEIGYSLRAKNWIWQIGRPRPMEKDPFYVIESIQGSHGTVGQQRSGASNGSAVNSNAALPDEVASPGNGTFILAISFTTNYNSLLHDGISIFADFATDTLGDYDLRVRLANAGGGVDFVLERINPQTQIQDGSGREIYRHHYWFDSALLASVGGGLDDIASCNVEFTNYTGSTADVTGVARASLRGG